jgi:pyruvate dehydrogenase E1 component alpha subunit
VGMRAAFKLGGQVITIYRDHGHMLAAGMSPRSVMAELSVSRGKSGSMHMFKGESGFYGGHGIVGSHISLGTSLSLDNSYRRGAVCFAYMWYGAVNHEQVAVSFDMAAVRKIDGMEVLAVRQAATEARARAAESGGPVILEMETYRYRGQSMSDPARYRTREEVDGVRAARDPVDCVLSLLDLGDGETRCKLNELRQAVNAAGLGSEESAARVGTGTRALRAAD